MVGGMREEGGSFQNTMSRWIGRELLLNVSCAELEMGASDSSRLRDGSVLWLRAAASGLSTVFPSSFVLTLRKR